ncbi:MAG: DNA methyltransferase [Candidatus Contendobacter sp.]|nr:DNA methyltransferase [Candidatus Contendobacter sp.]
MPPRKKNPDSSPTIAVDSHKHTTATRTNIPTEELRDFVAEDEAAPKTMRYPRNPDLDPQLVWKGKDEQDREDLAVPVVPVYIQEKIHPQAIIEDVRASAKRGQAGTLDLFADFNGIEFDQLIEFYRHNQHWQNRLILGDSLLVMSSLAEKEGLKGQVQMIYLDPPYGIKFGSNWQVSTRKRDVKDGKAEDATRQPEQIKAFRDTWQLGIHSYLAYLRDRLQVARELLTESGSIFVQIGDENVHLVRCLLDEVFGSENFIVTINLKKKGNQKGGGFESITDYILYYTKDKEQHKFRPLFTEREDSNEGFVSDQLTSGGLRTNQNYIYKTRGRDFSPAVGNCWKILNPGMRRVEMSDRLLIGPGQIRFKKIDTDFGFSAVTNNWEDTGGATDAVYVVQTATKVIQRCLLMTTDPGDP